MGIPPAALGHSRCDCEDSMKHFMVAVEIDGVVDTHIKYFSGEYATLCGLDGNDTHPSVNQRPAKTGDKVTCSLCHSIYQQCTRFRAGDFAVKQS